MDARAADPYAYGGDYYVAVQPSFEPMLLPPSQQPAPYPAPQLKNGPKLVHICSLALMGLFLAITSYSIAHMYAVSMEVTDTSRSESSDPKRRTTESTSEVVHTVPRNKFGRAPKENKAVPGYYPLQKDVPEKMNAVRPRIGRGKIPPPLKVSEGWMDRSTTTHATRRARRPRRRPDISSATSPRRTSGYTWTAGISGNSSSKRSSLTGTFVKRGNLLASISTTQKAPTSHKTVATTVYIDTKWRPIMPYNDRKRITTEIIPTEQAEESARFTML